MIPRECKRLAEVDFPIAEVSKHSAREKSIHYGHPSTLHLWWARRPLAACRAMLMALLLPDPCDENCPTDFKDKARRLLPRLTGSVGPSDMDLRRKLLKFIADFSNWENSANALYLEISRALVKAAYPEETPLVVDPFAGGGSIPLEALRVGCDAFASDLNPVACLILKVMMEDIPRHGPELAEELRKVGKEIKEKAEKELTEFYPKDPDGATPIAYLWARTVRCEAPNCGAEIPLMRSFWLCKKANRKRALKPVVAKSKGAAPHIEFDIFEPKKESDVHEGTVARAKATCLCCGTVLSPERVRSQLAAQRGGADVIFDEKGNRIGGARLLAVIMLKHGEMGRQYRLSTGNDYRAAWKAQKRVSKILNEWESGGERGLCPVPDEPLPPIGTLGFRVQRYGMLQWGDLFTARQKVALISYVDLINSINQMILPFMSCALSRVAMSGMSCTRWNAIAEKMQHTFGRQALPIVWDFAEVVSVADAPGNWQSGYDLVADVTSFIPQLIPIGQVQQLNACSLPLPDDAVHLLFTDPPYYDAIPYSDLSDFFLVWLKRVFRRKPFVFDPFDSYNLLSPKSHEAVQDETKSINGRIKDRAFFEEIMEKAFYESRRFLREDGLGLVVFAHKTTEGWEALLSAMIRSGWVLTGSWPVSTELPTRLRAMDSAALATSVHLVCRPRPDDARIGDWGEVLRELPQKVSDWMERLQCEGVRGADLVFACIGPALEIFSKFSKVETADGREIPLAEYLEKVWEVVGRSALEQVLGTAEAQARNGMAGALEEDARLTALFLWTLQSTNGESTSAGTEDDDEDESDDDEETEKGGKTKGYSLVYDVVRRFAQPLGIELPAWEGRVIEIKKGVVRLLPVSERVKQLFGGEATTRAAEWIEREPDGDIQQVLFPEHETGAPKVRGRKKGKVHIGEGAELSKERPATTLDRVHAAMLFQASGQANALRALIKAEQDRGSDFVRLANALSALYPMGSEEKRLLDAMLLAVPR